MNNPHPCWPWWAGNESSDDELEAEGVEEEEDDEEGFNSPLFK